MLQFNKTIEDENKKVISIGFTVDKKEYTRKIKKGIISFKGAKYFYYNRALFAVPTRIGKVETWRGWNGYEQELSNIVAHYKTNTKERTVGRPNGNGHMNVYSGEIEVRKNHQIHGGTYGINRSLPYAVTVGSNVEREIANEIVNEVAYVSFQFSNLTYGDRPPYFISKYGTSFSTYGLGA